MADLPGQSMETFPAASVFHALGTSAANTAKTTTQAANASKRHYITGITVSVSAAASAADVLVELKDGATVVDRWYINAVRGIAINEQYTHPIRGTKNTAMNLVVAAGGAAAVTDAVLHGYTA